MRYLAAFLLGATLSVGAEAAPLSNYTGFVAFGDSLTDGGRVYQLSGGAVPAIPPGSPPGPGYYAGRFSNGPVWADLISANFAASANFAFGFSGAVDDKTPPFGEFIPDLGAQIALASLSTQGFATLGSRPLAAVWTGANDVFRYLESGGTTPAPDAAAAAVIAGIKALVDAGIEDILAFTLPDFSLIPRFAKFQQLAKPAVKTAAALFNSALLAALPEIEGAKIETVRMDVLFDGLAADPGAYGISEFDNPCVDPEPPNYTPTITSPPVRAICPDPSGYAFFDANHPSATLHGAIAREVEWAITIAPVPLPATLPLAAVGVGLLLVVGRRRG